MCERSYLDGLVGYANRVEHLIEVVRDKTVTGPRGTNKLAYLPLDSLHRSASNVMRARTTERRRQ